MGHLYYRTKHIQVYRKTQTKTGWDYVRIYYTYIQTYRKPRPVIGEIQKTKQNMFLPLDRVVVVFCAKVSLGKGETIGVQPGV